MPNPEIDEFGNKMWYSKGYLHRLDGPAVHYANGDKQWYLNGKWLTEEEHRWATVLDRLANA